uniref:Basic blue protein n=1 Tax=Fagus sylvatica TaxID=28930 RepID=A0A2N9FFS4_FAGSY
MEMENLGDLRREGTGGGELFANEIAGGDMRDTEEVGGHGGEGGTFGLAQRNEIAGGDVRDTEEVREARGVGAFSDAGAAKENPLDTVVVMAEREGLSVKATYTVGDSGGWTFNTDSWPKGKRFRAGDVLIFNYDSTTHNVVAVDRAGYSSCTAPAGAKVYNTGKDQIKLGKGQNYFICNFSGHCASGMKTKHHQPESQTKQPRAPAPTKRRAAWRREGGSRWVAVGRGGAAWRGLAVGRGFGLRGSGWVVGWIFGGFRWGFALWWVGVGYGVALGGFVRYVPPIKWEKFSLLELEKKAQDQQPEPLAVPEEPVKVKEVPVVPVVVEEVKVEKKLVEKVEEKPIVVELEPEAKPV